MELESKLIELFIRCDDFMPVYQRWLSARALSAQGNIKTVRPRVGTLKTSEMMTILVFFHVSRFRDFKHYYEHYVLVHLKADFPYAPSYSRFIQLQNRAFSPLLLLMLRKALGKPTGISYIDSTILPVCHTRRINQHKVFKGHAARGKSSTGWFYGFKLHLIMNHLGEIVAISLTPGNTDDRNPAMLRNLLKGIWGKLFGDRGYIGKKLAASLASCGIELLTKSRKNMKPVPRSLLDSLLLQQRSCIECVNDSLKNGAMIIHSRFRSLACFCLNILAAVITFAFFLNKPAIEWHLPYLNNAQTRALEVYRL
jgi:Transposase DDE domain